MYKKYKLESAMPGDPPLHFEWDIETGDIRGPGAPLVQREVSRALAQGNVAGMPFPTVFAIGDPLHNLSEMAAILGNFWLLDGELKAAYPRAGDVDDAPGSALDLPPL
jgi:hypothetical protein